jgi:hypothetical protein
MAKPPDQNPTPATAASATGSSKTMRKAKARKDRIVAGWRRRIRRWGLLQIHDREGSLR